MKAKNTIIPVYVTVKFVIGSGELLIATCKLIKEGKKPTKQNILDRIEDEIYDGGSYWYGRYIEEYTEQIEQQAKDIVSRIFL